MSYIKAIGSKPLLFYTSTTERMRLDASGNVGIGKTPVVRFDVAGGRSHFAANNEVYAVGVKYTDSSGPFYLGATNSATPDLLFSSSGGSELVRITNSGQVGIGGSPSYVVDILENSANSRLRLKSSAASGTVGLFLIPNNNATAGWTMKANGTTAPSLEFYADGGIGSVLTMTHAGGHIGVNTATPNYGGWGKAVTIGGAGNCSFEMATTTDADGQSIGGLDFIAAGNTSGKEAAQISAVISGTTAANRGANLLFWTKPDGGSVTTRMRITASGQIFLSDSLYTSTSSKAIVAGSGGSTYGVLNIIGQAAPSSGNYYLTIREWTNSTNYFYIKDNGECYVHGRLGVGVAPTNGVVHISSFVAHTPATYSGAGANSAWTIGQTASINVAAYGVWSAVFNGVYSYSDKRMKKDIEDITSQEALDFVKLVNPVKFKWKSNDEDDYGFIAQNVLKAGFPKLVSALPEENLSETNEDGIISPENKKLVVKYEATIPLLLKAIRELLDKNEKLEDKLMWIEKNILKNH